MILVINNIVILILINNVILRRQKFENIGKYLFLLHNQNSSSSNITITPLLAGLVPLAIRRFQATRSDAIVGSNPLEDLTSNEICVNFCGERRRTCHN